MTSPMYEVIRNVYEDDAGNHMNRAVARGELLYKYLGYTYGCIGEDGVAVSENGSLLPPFHQLPRDAVREVE